MICSFPLPLPLASIVAPPVRRPLSPVLPALSSDSDSGCLSVFQPLFADLKNRLISMEESATVFSDIIVALRYIFVTFFGFMS